MLFDRRNKPSMARQVVHLFWPKSGWRRAGRYYAHRVRRMPGTPYAIAAGFACGAAVSMTPFPGFHFILAGLTAWLIGGSILASAIGTAVGNPWTFPFIWFWIYQLGNWMIGSGDGLGRHEITLSFLFSHPMEVLLPMMVGAAPTAVVTWIAFYWPVKRMVTTYQHRRRNRLARSEPSSAPAMDAK